MATLLCFGTFFTVICANKNGWEVLKKQPVTDAEMYAALLDIVKGTATTKTEVSMARAEKNNPDKTTYEKAANVAKRCSKGIPSIQSAPCRAKLKTRLEKNKIELMADVFSFVEEFIDVDCRKRLGKSIIELIVTSNLDDEVSFGIGRECIYKRDIKNKTVTSFNLTELLIGVLSYILDANIKNELGRDTLINKEHWGKYVKPQLCPDGVSIDWEISISEYNPALEGQKSNNSSDSKKMLFISYCHHDQAIVDIVENSIRKQLSDRVLISTFSEVQYKQSFKEFMRSIKEHDFVLSIVSDSYLKSKACMYEIGEIIHTEAFKEKMLFVLISENERKYYSSETELIAADVYSDEGRIAYIEYWENKYAAVEKKLSTILGKITKAEINKQLSELHKIIELDLRPFLEYISDVNGLSFQRLSANNFSAIVDQIEPKILTAVNDTELPDVVSFFDGYNTNDVEGLLIKKRWEENKDASSLVVPIGYSAKGTLLNFDIHEKKEGPNGLVFGMPGSGKSEFLLSYILSLAVNYSPNNVEVLLIDYKMANFHVLKNLPHVYRIIYKFDDPELQTLDDILKRRMSLLNEKGAVNIDVYNSYGSSQIPHIVVIVDEFGELKRENPVAFGNLLRFCRVGHSLGVHLILGTQNPSGLVNDEIYKNSQSMIAFRAKDNDVFFSNAPIDLSALNKPGRAYLRTGMDDYTLFQALYSGHDVQDGVHVKSERQLILDEISSFEKPKTESDLPLAAVQKPFLCYGTFTNILFSYVESGRTLNSFHTALLKSINDAAYLDDLTVNQLAKCKRNVSNEFKEIGLKHFGRKTVSEYFRTNIIPLISVDNLKCAIEAICMLMADDETIGDDEIIEVIGMESKSVILERESFIASDFLAGVFLYCVVRGRNIDGAGTLSNIQKYLRKDSRESKLIKIWEYVKEASQNTDFYFDRTVYEIGELDRHKMAAAMTYSILRSKNDFHVDDDITEVISETYSNIEKIGEGGASSVYKALHTRLNKTVAIKKDKKISNKNYELSRNETDVLKLVKHKYLPQLFDVISDSDCNWIVMEFIEGQDLMQYMKSQNIIDGGNLLKYAKQLCEVVGYLHSLTPPIIHADIKPGNIMLTPNNDICLIDFNLSKLLDDEQSLAPFGITRGFAAPEMYSEKAINPNRGVLSQKSDIYSIGATLFYLATATRPSFELSKSIKSMIMDKNLKKIIQHCTEENPARRYASTEEIIKDLSRVPKKGFVIHKKPMQMEPIVKPLFDDFETQFTEVDNEPHLSNEKNDSYTGNKSVIGGDILTDKAIKLDFGSGNSFGNVVIGRTDSDETKKEEK